MKMIMMLLVCSIFGILTFNIYAFKLHPIFDVQQFNDFNYGDQIQEHFVSDSVIEVKSNMCLDPKPNVLENNKDVSRLRVIVPTENLLSVWNSKDYILQYNVYCDGNRTNLNQYYIYQKGVTLDKAIEYTRFSIEVGKCKGGGTRKIKAFKLFAYKSGRLIFFGKKAIGSNVTNCERVTNFKTAYINGLFDPLLNNQVDPDSIEVPVHKLNQLSDIQQFNDLNFGDEIQQHFKKSPIIEVNNNSMCLDPKFNGGKDDKDVSKLRLVVQTEKLLEVWNDGISSLEFFVYCNGAKKNKNFYDFYREGVTLDKAIKYTRFSIEVGRCKNGKHDMKSIELRVNFRGDENSFGIKTIDPNVKNCRVITNFKTIFIETFLINRFNPDK